MLVLQKIASTLQGGQEHIDHGCHLEVEYPQKVEQSEDSTLSLLWE